MLRRVSVCLGLLVGLIVSAASSSPPAAAAPACPAPPAPMTFAAPKYLDTGRAGGEPMVATHPDGTLLIGTHAGTTHFFTPAVGSPTSLAFLENYNGQTYDYWSADSGKTWTFVPRPVPPSGLPASGFSDPDFAIDAAGQVFISEINLINIAMSKSTDSGRTYTLQNVFAQTITDRQWTEADEKDVVYEVGNAAGGGTSTQPVGNVGHYLYKSKDGGVTFTPGIADNKEGDGLGDLRVDKRNGTLYEAHLSDDGKKLSMAAFRNARRDDMTPEVNTIADGVSMLSHWPAFDLDPEGNLSIVWDESGRGDAKRAAGIYYSYSTDAGRTWATPQRVDTDDHTDIWPWLAVGDKGKVAIAWFEADVKLPDEDAETPGTHGWHVFTAQTLNGAGCDGGGLPTFSVVKATTEPFHTGTICQGGTACQAQAIDRRLGDYFAIGIDGPGHMYAVYSDTRQGGAVSLAAILQQSGGPLFRATPLGATQQAAAPPAAPAPAPGGALPRTGGGGFTDAAPGLLVLLGAALVVLLRRQVR